ncbi:MAG: hypothetical protein ACREI8_04080 [Myxococcota bacterium]
MFVAHVDLANPSIEEVAPRRALRRLATLLGRLGMFALAAVPGGFALLLLMRPDLVLPH